MHLAKSLKITLMAVAGIVAAATAVAFLYRNELRWIPISSPDDRYIDAFYERKFWPDQTIRPTRRILYNLRERGDKSEASHIYEFEFDCFHERSEAKKGVWYFNKFGQGDEMRTVQKGLWNVGGIAVGKAMKEICAPIMANPGRRAAENVPPWNFPFSRFLTCSQNTSADGRKHLEAMRARLVPLAKKDGAWTYKTEGQVSLHSQNFPVSATLLGVCSRDGESGCGQASYTALHLNMKADDARNRLRLLGNNWGQDYTVELRDPESQVTRRPVLVADPDDRQKSYLYCDSGSL